MTSGQEDELTRRRANNSQIPAIHDPIRILQFYKFVTQKNTDKKILKFKQLLRSSWVCDKSRDPKEHTTRILQSYKFVTQEKSYNSTN